VLHHHELLLLLLSFCRWEAGRSLWVLLLEQLQLRQTRVLLLQLLLSMPLPAAAAFGGSQLSQNGTCWLCQPAGCSTSTAFCSMH
jgi:hypothetical protein